MTLKASHPFSCY